MKVKVKVMVRARARATAGTGVVVRIGVARVGARREGDAATTGQQRRARVHALHPLHLRSRRRSSLTPQQSQGDGSGCVMQVCPMWGFALVRRDAGCRMQTEVAPGACHDEACRQATFPRSLGHARAHCGLRRRADERALCVTMQPGA